MLYMVIATHGPETCAAVVDEAKKRALAMGPRMEEASKAHDCTIQGGWISRSNHTSYLLVEAPNAHAIEDTIWDLELAHWNTVAIHPVVTVEDAMKWLAEA
ncbi:MAG: DUF3303 family protein [Dehalococcoidia bacterium]